MRPIAWLFRTKEPLILVKDNPINLKFPSLHQTKLLPRNHTVSQLNTNKFLVILQITSEKALKEYYSVEHICYNSHKNSYINYSKSST